LVNSDGLALGTLCVIDRVPRELTDEQALTLKRLAQTAVTTLELRRAMNRARDFALVDIMTGLPNRAAMIAALDRAIARQNRHGSLFNLLYFDLDGFKGINDISGHAQGDRVLREVAALLTATCRGDDFAARLGGDEFAILQLGGETNAQIAAERIRTEIQDHMRKNGWAVTASVGAATFAAAPTSPYVAFMAADALMYAAKTAGKNQVRYRTIA
jgi:diguanylate cyclase (GGDEF)-like protein